MQNELQGPLFERYENSKMVTEAFSQAWGPPAHGASCDHTGMSHTQDDNPAQAA